MTGFITGTLKLTLKYLLIFLATLVIGVTIDNCTLAFGVLLAGVGYSQVIAKRKAEK